MVNNLKLTKNNPEYWEYIRSLRNNEFVKQGFIQQEEITIEQQVEYMKKYNDNFFICLMDNKPCGYIGVIDDDIRIATDPSYQKLGVGFFMISEIKKLFPDAKAKIKIDNEASLKLFQKSGYVVKYYLLELE